MYFTDELIAPYYGTVFPKEEVEVKERDHEDKKYPSAIYKLTQLYLDPYQYKGKELNPKQNPGVWLNHSRLSPNAKVVPVREAGEIIGCIVMAIKDISSGEEVKQDYGSEQGTAGPSFLKQ